MSPDTRQPVSKASPGIFSNRRLIVLIVVLVLVTGALLISRNPTSEDTSTDNGSASVNEQTLPAAAKQAKQDLQLPDGWEEIVLKNDQRTPGFVLRAKHDDPEASAVITSYEGKLEKNFQIKTIPGPLVERFREKVAGFKLVKQEIAKVGGYDVVKIRYIQQDDESTFEKLHVVMPTPDATYYFNFQAAKGQYQKIESEINQILEDFAKSVGNA